MRTTGATLDRAVDTLVSRYREVLIAGIAFYLIPDNLANYCARITDESLLSQVLDFVQYAACVPYVSFLAVVFSGTQTHRPALSLGRVFRIAISGIAGVALIVGARFAIQEGLMVLYLVASPALNVYKSLWPAYSCYTFVITFVGFIAVVAVIVARTEGQNISHSVRLAIERTLTYGGWPQTVAVVAALSALLIALQWTYSWVVTTFKIPPESPIPFGAYTIGGFAISALAIAAASIANSDARDRIEGRDLYTRLARAK